MQKKSITVKHLVRSFFLTLLFIGVQQMFAQEQSGYIKVKKGVKYGLVSPNGSTVLEPQYDELGSLSQGIMAFREGDKWGAIDVSGKVVIPAKYGDNFTFVNGLALTSNLGKPGAVVIDKTGKPVLSTGHVFSAFDGFRLGVEPVTEQKKFKCGLINKAGKNVPANVLDFTYDEMNKATEGLFRFKKGNNYGFVDNTGKVVIKSVYEEATPFQYGMSIVKQAMKMGVIAKDGTFKIALGAYSRIFGYNDGTMRMVKNKLMGYIDAKGEVIVPPTYESIGNFNEGYATILMSGKYGLIDSTGKVVVPPTYSSMGEFSDGLIEVIVNGKSGFIDAKGTMVIKPTFEPSEDPYNFKFGYRIIHKGPKYGLIDKTGKIVVAPKYEELIRIGEGIYRCKVGEKYGIIDHSDKSILPIQYEEIGTVEN